MTRFLRSGIAGLLCATVFGAGLTMPCAAETVLRLDDVPVGELDPAKATDRADSILMFNVYDTLVLPKQGGQGQAPHLATGWETVDGRAYTFKLRQNVRFQSGNPLTADDVVFSLDRLKSLQTGFAYLFENVESVQALDAHTVKFNLKAPSAAFVPSLVRLPIIDKKLVVANLGAGDGPMRDWGSAYLSGHGAGTGAYAVISQNPQQETVLAKNHDYFLGIPSAAPDTVRFRYGLEAATVRALIARDEHDISSIFLPSEVLRSMAAEGSKLVSETSSGAYYAKMNTQKPPLDDVNCRKALSAAFDYATGIRMVSVADGVALGRPATGAIPVGMIGANPAGQFLKRDVDAAKKHLAACKYKPSDFTLEIAWVGEIPVEERFALLMQANFAEIGIKSQITKVPWALFTEMAGKPETTPNISQVLYNAVTGDPDALLYGMYHSASSGTWRSAEHLHDQKVDELLEKGRSAATQQDRELAYAELNKRLMELSATIYVYDRNNIVATSNRVGIPAVSDSSKAFALDSMGFVFRLMEMSQASN